MKKEINHFMWGYQRSFRVCQEIAARALFRKLDKRFTPEVFVVGVRSDGTPDKFPGCVDPEDDYWIPSESFAAVPAISEGLRQAYPEASMFQSHPLAQKRQDEDLLKRSIQDAIGQIIDSHPMKSSEMRFRVSYPAQIDSYWVSLVLGLQRNVLSEYDSLQQTFVKMHEHRNIPVPTSLTEAAADIFLEESTRELLGPDPGLGTNRREPDEMLRSAGDRFMTGLVWRIDPNCMEGMSGLFRSLTTISSLRYEKNAGVGRILITRKNHPSVAQKISFAAPVKMTSCRSVRKLLELASDELPLHCDPDQSYGLAEELTYNPNTEDLFHVQVLGHHYWELKHAGRILMRVQYGLPSLPKLPFDEAKFRTDLPRIFSGITTADTERLVAFVKVAERESRGTMLVVTEAAASEAARLAPQGTPLTPYLLDPKTLANLTPIDGAIILDPTGTCHAIGTILDGKATGYGDPSRGARYNSALRYFESTTASCMIVVVSSDGGVDFVPDPSPSIRRSSIDSALDTILRFESAEKIAETLYRQTLDWLDAHKFYLTDEDCKTLNEVIDRLEKRIRRESEATLWVVRSPFAPHPAMNAALYYTNE
jgi:DisA bacterial checkpoint controller nucleotide-binding